MSNLEEPKKRSFRSSLPPDQLNFSQIPTVHHSFVDYFLKSEDGIASVLNLAETKLEYEKKCKSIIAEMPKPNRSQAQQFFKKVTEAIQVKFPETNHTVIAHYHLDKYLEPIVTAMQLKAKNEVDAINKCFMQYIQHHSYILTVVNFIEERLRQKQAINPDALVDVETHLLAGVMSRFYPLFIKMKDAAIDLSSKNESANLISSEDFIVQLKKLMLAIYVEIICIGVTFNNTLTSLSQLSNAQAQEKYRNQMAIRKTHARHAVTWAAHCITSVLLYYHIEIVIGVNTHNPS